MVDTLKTKGVWVRSTLRADATVIGGGGKLNNLVRSGDVRGFVCEWSR